jgi:hypothetical protein
MAMAGGEVDEVGTAESGVGSAETVQTRLSESSSDDAVLIALNEMRLMLQEAATKSLLEHEAQEVRAKEEVSRRDASDARIVELTSRVTQLASEVRDQRHGSIVSKPIRMMTDQSGLSGAETESEAVAGTSRSNGGLFTSPPQRKKPKSGKGKSPAAVRAQQQAQRQSGAVTPDQLQPDSAAKESGVVSAPESFQRVTYKRTSFAELLSQKTGVPAPWVHGPVGGVAPLPEAAGRGTRASSRGGATAPLKAMVQGTPANVGAPASDAAGGAPSTSLRDGGAGSSIGEREQVRIDRCKLALARVNARCLNLIIGDSHLHRVDGSSVTNTLYVARAGGLCFPALAKALEATEPRQHIRSVLVALGTNDLIHHRSRDFDHGPGVFEVVRLLGEKFPGAKLGLLEPFNSPRLRLLRAPLDEFRTLLRSARGAVTHRSLETTRAWFCDDGVHLVDEGRSALIGRLREIYCPARAAEYRNEAPPGPVELRQFRAWRQSQSGY